ncbi:MAG: tRNA glutamyl-Q(34) synthetase GluQRS [Gammaproteobacteria bacterium]|nr:tRNA glutamyl-Q(34) synthetase GluQRS [Gammaproteobacteria bacterium]
MYVGRFAPSPTGPLHFGSLTTAIASFLDARSQGGRWRVRMEDVDKPREQPGAADAILRALDAFALHWDGPVLYQSQRLELYHDAVEHLRVAGRTFACTCTRREIADSAAPPFLAGQEGPIYPGTCRPGIRNGIRNDLPTRALRVHVDAEPIGFEDRLQGYFEQNLARDVGDFVIVRADGFIAYQLAVVADDAAQGITHVVRGSDLLFSTPRQILLQRLLGYATPRYLHLPIAVDDSGEKLSKQTFAAPIDGLQPQRAVCAALMFLGQDLPPDAEYLSLTALWDYAGAHWNPERIPRTTAQHCSLG